jgi:hypothetical protein
LRVAQFFTLRRAICRKSRTAGNLRRHDPCHPRIREHRVFPQLIRPTQPQPADRAGIAPTLAGPYKQCFAHGNALGMQGECASDALGTSQECAHFAPKGPFWSPNAPVPDFSGFERQLTVRQVSILHRGADDTNPKRQRGRLVTPSLALRVSMECAIPYRVQYNLSVYPLERSSCLCTPFCFIRAASTAHLRASARNVTPAGVKEISRGLSAATPPVRSHKFNLHPGRGASSRCSTKRDCCHARSPIEAVRRTDTGHCCDPCRGRVQILRTCSGGVASLNPRLIALTPPGSISELTLEPAHQEHQIDRPYLLILARPVERS